MIDYREANSVQELKSLLKVIRLFIIQSFFC